MKTFIFACIHNAGRSQMSAAFFNRMADSNKARAISAGTKPGTQVHPVVVNAMLETNIDLSDAKPQLLTPELAQEAEMLVSMGCGDDCPYIPGLRRQDWPLPDPKGKTIKEVRAIRDEIQCRVAELLRAEQLGLVDAGDMLRGLSILAVALLHIRLAMHFAGTRIGAG